MKLSASNPKFAFAVAGFAAALIAGYLWFPASSNSAPRVSVTVLVEPTWTFTFVGKFSEGLAAVSKDGETIGYVEKTGSFVIPPSFDGMGSSGGGGAPFSEGLALVRNRGDSENWQDGFIDKTGNVIIPLEYDDAVSFSEGLALVGKGSDWATRKYSFIDKTGRIVMPLEYDAVSHFSEGLAMVGKSYSFNQWKFGFIDKSGNVVVPLEYDTVGTFSDGLAWAIKERNDIDGSEHDDFERVAEIKYGYIDKNGNIIIPFEHILPLDPESFDFALGHEGVGFLNFSEGLAVYGESIGMIAIGESMTETGDIQQIFSRDILYGYIDKSGKVVIPAEYNSASSFSEGRAVVSKGSSCENMKWGFVDTSGKIVIPLEYDSVSDFSEGLAVVSRKNQGTGYIDKAGEVIVPLEYDAAYPFSEGLAWVQKDGKWGILLLDPIARQP